MNLLNETNIISIYAKMNELNGGKLDIDSKDYTLRLRDAEIHVYMDGNTLKTDVREFEEDKNILLSTDLTVEQVLAGVIAL